VKLVGFCFSAAPDAGSIKKSLPLLVHKSRDFSRLDAVFTVPNKLVRKKSGKTLVGLCKWLNFNDFLEQGDKAWEAGVLPLNHIRI
jgi:hypothetical protein